MDGGPSLQTNTSRFGIPPPRTRTQTTDTLLRSLLPALQIVCCSSLHQGPSEGPDRLTGSHPGSDELPCDHDLLMALLQVWVKRSFPEGAFRHMSPVIWPSAPLYQNFVNSLTYSPEPAAVCLQIRSLYFRASSDIYSSMGQADTQCRKRRATPSGKRYQQRERETTAANSMT